MIQVNNLSKSFKGPHGEIIHALDKVNFSVGEGTFFTLLGPSGCGKTTLLRLVAGLERPESGEIQIGDQVVCSMGKKIFIQPNERDIGMVFQSYAIWPHMTVFENVAFPLTVSKKHYSKNEIVERVEKVLAILQLDGLMERPAPNLSGGQQQRLALARALVREPKVLLLDEPLSNLDAKLREQLRVELRQLQRQLGITTIYVTHDQTEALAMSNSIAVMSKGKIVEIGSPKEIYEHPNTQFTADFVGSTNFFSGRVMGHQNKDGVRIVEIEQGNLFCKVSEDVAIGERVLISIRPQDVQISCENRPEANNHFSGILRERLYLGEYIDCQVEIGTSLIRVFLNPSLDIQQGEKVEIFFPEGSCIVIPGMKDVVD